MKNIQNLKKCDVCKNEPKSICFKCMNYYCDSCFKIAHTKEEFKTHKKENIDYFNFIEVRCPEHKLSPMNLFCLDEKGN